MVASSDPFLNVAFAHHAHQIREAWQVRLLARTQWVKGSGIIVPNDEVGAVVLSVLAHSFKDTLELMLRVAFPEYQGIGVPFLCTAARINKDGEIYAEWISKTGERERRVFFRSTIGMEAVFRRLADRMGFHGSERLSFFGAVTRWVVADFRVDPNRGVA